MIFTSGVWYWLGFAIAVIFGLYTLYLLGVLALAGIKLAWFNKYLG